VKTFGPSCVQSPVTFCHNEQLRRTTGRVEVRRLCRAIRNQANDVKLIWRPRHVMSSRPADWRLITPWQRRRRRRSSFVARCRRSRISGGARRSCNLLTGGLIAARRPPPLWHRPWAMSRRPYWATLAVTCPRCMVTCPAWIFINAQDTRDVDGRGDIIGLSVNKARRHVVGIPIVNKGVSENAEIRKFLCHTSISRRKTYKVW